MDFKSLSNGMKLALVGGAVLVVNLFLPWYGVFGFNINAFDVGFLAWGGSFIAIAGAVLLLLKEMGTKDVTAGEFKTEQIAVALGALGFVLILLRWLTESNLVKFGLYLGILASAAVAAGAFMAMKDAGLGLPGIGGSGGGASGGGTGGGTGSGGTDWGSGGGQPGTGGGQPGTGGGQPGTGGGPADPPPSQGGG
jgi:hypothetical protein